MFSANTHNKAPLQEQKRTKERSDHFCASFIKFYIRKRDHVLWFVYDFTNPVDIIRLNQV